MAAKRPLGWAGARVRPRTSGAEPVPTGPHRSFKPVMGSVLAVANQKGGVGKTTTAVNLGASIAGAGYPTLLVDLDPQCNATVALGLPKDSARTSTSASSGELTLAAAALPSGIEHLHVVPSTPELAGATVELPRIAGSEGILRDRLGAVKERYLFTLLDCPPSLGPLTVNALVAADKVIVPVQTEYFALEGLAAAARHAVADPARAQPAAHGRRDDPDDARRPHAARARRRARGARALPGARLRHRRPAQRARSARRRASAFRSSSTLRTAPEAPRTSSSQRRSRPVVEVMPSGCGSKRS